MNNVKFWIGEHMTIDSPAAKQIKDISELPILAGHLSIMPDVHMGKYASTGGFGRHCRNFKTSVMRERITKLSIEVY